MIVVYCFSRSLYGQIRPSLCSLLTNANPEKIYFMIEDDHIDGYDFPPNVEIVQVKYTDWFRPNCQNMRGFHYMALMKQTVSKYIKEPKCIVLDLDTIILDDLKDLWNTDLTGKWFAGVNEYKGNQRAYGPTYVNAGVLLWNLDQVRKDGFDDRVIHLLNTKRMWLTEQDAINELRENKFELLPVRYNESFCTGETINPAIVHFAGIPDWYTRRNIKRREILDEWINREFPAYPPKEKD